MNDEVLPNMSFASPVVFLGCVIWFDYHCGLGLLQEMSLAFVFLGAGKPFLWKILRSCADVFCYCGKRLKKFSPPGENPQEIMVFLHPSSLPDFLHPINRTLGIRDSRKKHPKPRDPASINGVIVRGGCFSTGSDAANRKKDLCVRRPRI